MKPSLVEATDRFVEMAFKENPDIKSPSELKVALFKVFDSPRGNNATGQFNDEEIMTFFESKECQDRLKENIGEEKADELFKEAQKGEFEVLRTKPKGEKILPSQVRIIHTPKKVSVQSYYRNKKPVKSYHKGYTRWTTKEIKFLQVRKMRKVPARIIVNDYNKHFKISRSSSSLKTKVYRL